MGWQGVRCGPEATVAEQPLRFCGAFRPRTVEFFAAIEALVPLEGQCPPQIHATGTVELCAAVTVRENVFWVEVVGEQQAREAKMRAEQL